MLIEAVRRLAGRREEEGRDARARGPHAGLVVVAAEPRDLRAGELRCAGGIAHDQALGEPGGRDPACEPATDLARRSGDGDHARRLQPRAISGSAGRSRRDPRHR
jgi:hypothetical protein